jgi:hypothetical protein
VTGTGERAYAYAKACGIIGKSFVGNRIRGLEKVSRLSELDRMVFPASARDLPERELLIDLEDRIISRAVNSIIAIMECFSNPPEFLTRLVRSYEYADLKSALIASREPMLSLEKQSAAPVHTDIGRYQTVRFGAWPDVRAMLERTEFDFLLDKGALRAGLESIGIETALDQHYYAALWKSLMTLPKNDRRAAEKILSDEISLRNSGWVLRLRTYYDMDREEIKPHLIRVTEKSVKESAQCLDYPLDNYAPWASWRWKEFLNPDLGVWHADPRYFQNAASRHLYTLARRYFRLNPFSLDAVFCFIKLKQFEEDLLTSEAEGLGMGMPVRDIISILGIEA